ncbi:MAG: transcription termination factor NusA [Anaerolinea sp.]|nr:transcription termination factor NusA [Anaerolinea sp.]
MKNEFILAFNEVLEERQLPKDIIVKALEAAMVSAYRRSVNASNAQHVDARIDLDTGKITVFAEKEIVEEVQDPHTEVSLAEARRYNPEAELGQMIIVESTPKDFGRVAAQTARQVIQQRIRDAERQAQIDHFEQQVGEIISGNVQAVNAQGLTIGLEMKAEGTMPRKEMIPGERFRIHDRVRALLAEVKDSPRGPQIILSRTHRNFLRRLLETEVPEIYHGIVEIRSIAREPGERAKVAVSATQTGIDPVGACVGIRGVRIQAIVRELHDEKIDVIEWNSDPSIFIAKAISPARVSGVYLNDHSVNGKTATVVVPEDQLSLAIGRDGQNARLAAKLTGWRIDIKSLPEAASEALHRLESDESLAMIADLEQDSMVRVRDMLARKAEGRPLTPEEYDFMVKFIDRVENRSSSRRQPERQAAEEAILSEARRTIPASAFSTDLLDSGIPEHVAYILQEAGYTTSGELALQMKTRPDDILRLNGIGPKAMSEIRKLLERLEQQKQIEDAKAAAEQPVAATESETIETTPVAALEQPSQETIAVPVNEPEVTKPETITEPIASTIAEEENFADIFTLTVIEPPIITDDDEEAYEIETPKKSKKDKKKRRSAKVQIEYDPDKDMTIVHKKHKLGDDDSGWDY